MGVLDGQTAFILGATAGIAKRRRSFWPLTGPRCISWEDRSDAWRRPGTASWNNSECRNRSAKRRSGG